MSALLSVQGLTAGYGGVPIIEDIDLDVAEHEIAVIIGPNGAGKSTLLKTVFALTSRISGSVKFIDRDITALKTAQLVPLGISAVPQSRNVFPTLSVDENLDVGTYAAPPGDKQAVRETVLELFPDLKDKLDQPAGELSGGQRQMVAMGRALMSEPKLLLLDEPTAGLSPAYLEIIFDLLLDIRKRGVTILMVEQNAKQALRIADTGHVLVSGKNFVSGTGEALLADDAVRRSFLGGAAT
ncbi:ABC transporter ATP-binding protein [uncultured Hoeflea sp.]|uniref:ABC transporter ATP-binding protein n=1 Tax=uncultured Hoeflea sp. TaxID=538666 RepID=UPI002627AF0E|nr:ABC transporter ATP-binding protein [uncultured Hoeflea sp.]